MKATFRLMDSRCRALLLALAALGHSLLIGAPSARAQVPDTLLHSIPAPPGTLANSGFGRAVAVDGAFTVVGIPFDDAGSLDAGIVKVFNSSTGALRHVLRNPNPEIGDHFGASVAISGSRVVVGVPNALGLDDGGAVYVYDLSPGTPTVPVATIFNPRFGGGSEHFGTSVAISGTRVVVGAPGDNTKAIDAGTAQVFDVSSATPDVSIATLFSPNPAEADAFGSAVGISGSLVVVGSPSDDTGGARAGRAFVYDLTQSPASGPVFVLLNPNPADDKEFGLAVAISGTWVVAGAPGDRQAGNTAGSAYAFNLNGLTTDTPLPRTTFANPSPAAGDNFGRSVAIAGDRLVVGAPSDDISASNSGIAYVYEVTSPSPISFLYNPTPAEQDEFGGAVAISSTHVVVGASGDDTDLPNSGKAYLYTLVNGVPGALTVLNHAVIPSDDFFGSSVALTGPGIFSDTDVRLVVGIPLDDTGATDAGGAHVYTVTPTSVALALTVKNPTAGVGDFFGSAVAASGTRFIIGALADDTGEDNGGAAYVYDFNRPRQPDPVTLLEPVPVRRAFFGNSVAIGGANGLTVVEGAYESTFTGRAYVFLPGYNCRLT